MKAILNTRFSVTLELTEPEARWITKVMQKRIGSEEDYTDAEMREQLWKTLRSVLKGNNKQ